MINYCKIPLCSPFKFLPVRTTPGVHFDEHWYFEGIRKTDMRVQYLQKWQKAEKTKLQIESSIAPDALQVLEKVGTLAPVATFNWTVVFSGVGYAVYETEVDFTSLSEKIYLLYQKVEAGGFKREFITEPISVRDNWVDTLLVKYKNSRNDFGVAWSSGIEMLFRAELAIPDADLNPQREAIDYINQNRDVVVLNGVPFRVFTLYLGDLLLTPTCFGVAPWVLDLMNRIFDCDSVAIEDKLFAANPSAKWTVNRVKGYPLISAQLEVVEAKNLDSVEQSDTTDFAITNGIVTAYNIETGFFGARAQVPVTEVEKNS